MAYDIGPTVGVLGEAEFKKAMEGIGNEFKLLGSEMKLSVSQFDKNDKSMANLSAQSKVLVKEIDTQKGKISLINEQYDKQNTKLAELKAKLDAAKTSFAAGSDEVVRAQNEYNKQNTTVIGLNTQLNNANATLNKFTSELEKNQNAALHTAEAQKDLGEKTEAAGKKISGVGDSMTKFVTVPALAAATALAALVVKTVASADAIQLASDKYGMTTDRVQELTYAGKGLDVEFDTMASSQSKLIKSMTAANNGTEAQAEAFKTLGVEIVNSDGSFRDSNVVWGEVIDKLGQMPNETEASSTAMILLGKSAMDLNPLIRAGSGELAKLTDEAHKTGAVMSGESVAALDEFGDSVEKAKVAIGTAAGEITVKMLPTLNKLLPIVQKDIVPAIGEFAEGVGDLIVGFAEMDPITRGVVTTIAGLIVVAGPALKMVGTGITLVGIMNAALGAHKIAMATAAAATDGLAASEGAATVAGTGMLATLGPILLVAAAAAATSAVFIKLTETSRAELAETTALTTACIDSATAFEAQSAEAKTNTAVTQSLSDELFALSGKENKSNVEKTKMSSLVAQLNSQMPELNLAIDEQTGALDKNKESVDDLIKSKKDEIELQAQTERMIELRKEELDLTEQRTEAQKRADQSYKDNTILTVNGTAILFDYNSAVDNSRTELNKLDEQLAAVKTSLEHGDEALASSTAATIPYIDSILGTGKAVTETNEAITEATGKTAAELEEQAAAVQKSAEERQAIVEQYYSDLEQSERDHQAEMGSLETLGIERSDLTAAQLKKNRDQQVLDYQDWRAGLKLIAELIPADVLAELEKLGPKYDQVIDDLANMSPEQRAAWIESWYAPAVEIAKVVKEEIGTLPGAATQIGTETGFAFADAINAAIAAKKINPIQLTATFSAGMNLPRLPGFAVGTRYLPFDMLIQAHQGELIVPESENPYANSGNGQTLPTSTSTGVTINVASLVVREEADIPKVAKQLYALEVSARKAVGA